MMESLRIVDSIADGDKALFYEGFGLIRDFVKQNPGLPYAK